MAQYVEKIDFIYDQEEQEVEQEEEAYHHQQQQRQQQQAQQQRQWHTRPLNNDEDEMIRKVDEAVVVDEDDDDIEEEEEGESIWDTPPSLTPQTQKLSPTPHQRVPKAMSYTDETKLKVQRLKEAEQQQVRMQQEQKRRAYVQKAHLEEFRRSQRTKAIAAKQTEATGKSGNGNGKLLKVNKGIVTVVRANHAIASNEKSRVQTVREVIKAAIKIQRAYRRYRERRLNQQQQPVTRVKPKPPPIGIRSLRGGVGGGGGGGDSTTTVATTVTTTNSKKEILRARAPPPTNISPSSKKPQQQSQSQQLLQQQQSQQSLQSPKPPLGKSLSFQQTNANALGTRNSPRRASLGAAPTTAAPTAAPTTNATNGVGALTTIQQEHDHLQNHDHSGQGCKHKGCKGVYPTYRPFKATPAPKVRSQVVASSPPPKEHENPNAIAQALGYK